MAQFSVNAQRFDPYKNFKFRIKWDGRYVAGVSKVGGLKRTTEVVKHREGGDPSSTRKSPGRTEFQRGVIYLENGVFKVRVTGEHGSGILKSMSDANCFIMLHDHVGNVEAGATVDVQILEGVV